MSQVNPELVINDLLEQNKQQTLQLAMLRSALTQQQAVIDHLDTQLAEAREAAYGEAQQDIDSKDDY